MITMDFKEINNLVLIIGKTEGHLDQSLFARNILNEKIGPPPEINLFNEKNNGETILQLIKSNLVRSAHDVSIGGIITAVSKMCIKGNKGIEFNKPKTAPPKIENKTTTKIFSPNAILKDGTVNKLEHVITVNDATELNVPVHQPIKCACIKSA